MFETCARGSKKFSHWKLYNIGEGTDQFIATSGYKIEPMISIVEKYVAF